MASKNPFVMIGKAFEGIAAHARDSSSGGGGPGGARQTPGAVGSGGKPSGITGSPISSVVCLQDGVLTCGLDGAVRYHTLAADILA